MTQKPCDKCTQGVMDQGNAHLHDRCTCPCHEARPISFELAKLVCEVRHMTKLATEMHEEDKRLAVKYNEAKYPDPFEYIDAQAFLEAARKAQLAYKEFLGTDRYRRFSNVKEELGRKINQTVTLFQTEFGVEYPKLDR